jgi:carbon storage regulator
VLVLTRRPNQSIMIGDEIVITVLEVKGDQIRLGISAPRSVQVFREEVLIALQEANRSALMDPDAGPPAPGRPAADDVHRPPIPGGPGSGGASPAPGGSSGGAADRRPHPVPQAPSARPPSPRSAS